MSEREDVAVVIIATALAVVAIVTAAVSDDQDLVAACLGGAALCALLGAFTERYRRR